MSNKLLIFSTFVYYDEFEKDSCRGAVVIRETA